MYRQVARYLYNAPLAVDPPNIGHVFFTDSTRKNVTVEMRARFEILSVDSAGHRPFELESGSARIDSSYWTGSGLRLVLNIPADSNDALRYAEPRGGWFFWITNDAGLGVLSFSGIKIRKERIKTPTILSSESTSNGVELSWRESNDPLLESYRIYRGASISNMELAATVTAGSTSYTDSDVRVGESFYYAVCSQGSDGAMSERSFAKYVDIVVSAQSEDIGQPEDRDALSLEAFPNPCTDFCTIRLSGAKNTVESVSVFDVLGRRVATLSTDPGLPVRKEYVWRPTFLPSGTYFIVAEGGGRRTIKPLIHRR